MEASYTVLQVPSDEVPKDYLGFIYKSWLRSLRRGNKYFNEIERRHYYENYEPLIKIMMSELNSVTRLAVLTDDKDVVLGFSVCRNRFLDYVYVQKIQWKHGIGRSLIPDDIVAFTHITDMALDIRSKNKKYKSWDFTPFT